MNTLKFGVLLMILGTTIGCNNKKVEENKAPKVEIKDETKDYNELLIGSWVEKNPINENEVQGIEIIKGGAAKSINMATLVYKNWWVKNDSLFLVEESIGNRTSSIDTIGYKINNVDEKQLILTDKEYIITYNKQ